MARRKRRTDVDNTIDLDMTPMLDIVFNLIIFFMIVTDLTQQELEQLTLPKASEAVKDEGENIKKRMIINIEKNGTIKIKRTVYTLDTLQKRLYQFAELHRDADRFCDEPILIRADYNTQFEKIQSVMQECADPKIKIYKVQLAAAQTTPAARCRA